ncbi:hypothetical protein JCM10212_002879 [Sporobolomyces blumeae]
MPDHHRHLDHPVEHATHEVIKRVPIRPFCETIAGSFTRTLTRAVAPPPFHLVVNGWTAAVAIARHATFSTDDLFGQNVLHSRARSELLTVEYLAITENHGARDTASFGRDVDAYWRRLCQLQEVAVDDQISTQMPYSTGPSHPTSQRTSCRVEIAKIVPLFPLHGENAPEVLRKLVVRAEDALAPAGPAGRPTFYFPFSGPFFLSRLLLLRHLAETLEHTPAEHPRSSPLIVRIYSTLISMACYAFAMDHTDRGFGVYYYGAQHWEVLRAGGTDFGELWLDSNRTFLVEHDEQIKDWIEDAAAWWCPEEEDDEAERNYKSVKRWLERAHCMLHRGLGLPNTPYASLGHASSRRETVFFPRSRRF